MLLLDFTAYTLSFLVEDVGAGQLETQREETPGC